ARWTAMLQILSILSIGSKLGPQNLHDRRRPRNFRAAEFQSLQLGQQIAARRGGQSLQIFLELVGLGHRSMRTNNGYRRRLAASIKAGRRKLSRKNCRKMAPAEMAEFGSAVGKSSAAAANPRHFAQTVRFSSRAAARAEVVKSQPSTRLV